MLRNIKKKIPLNSLFAVVFIYIVILVVLYLSHPILDYGFFVLALMFAVFCGLMLYHEIKYPQEAKRFQNEMKKRTPGEIGQHMFKGVVVAVSPLVKGFVLLICAGLVFYLIYLVLNFFTK